VWLVSLAVIMMAGGVQLFIVRWFVGLNLLEKLDRITFFIPKSFKIVRACIDDKLLDTFEFSVKRDEPDLLLIRRQTDTKKTVVIVIGTDPDDALGTVLATVAFEQGTYELMRSVWASGDRENIVDQIDGRLKRIDPFLKMEPREPNDLLSGLAYDFSIRPTRSKFGLGAEFVGKIPKYFLVLIGFTVFLILLLSELFLIHYQNFDFNTYINTVVIAIFALIIEVGLALRGELSRGKKRRKVE
jgi:hypothetical protein